MLRSNNEKTLEFLRQICREEGYPENNPNMLEVLREEGRQFRPRQPEKAAGGAT